MGTGRPVSLLCVCSMTPHVAATAVVIARWRLRRVRCLGGRQRRGVSWMPMPSAACMPMQVRARAPRRVGYDWRLQ
ncbi:hypothetical protein NC00_14775 [Xanthomonas cannabis pv. phaseoli]|uniref:Secreted protein n=1 Tax=Xanthomonas cannabis pv. phaseoli TaxID=1885902 RepID=A0AB34P687_9XANT|nr:hypothetical protein NC00_14775 [Xanthomonas cannabis pv. phaseoli]